MGIGRKYNNLLLELNYLYAKVEYSDEVYEQAKREFEEYATEFCEENGVEIEGSFIPNEEVTDIDLMRDEFCDNIDFEADNTNALCKTLFKKIAIKTHPDVLRAFSPEEKSRKSKQFKEARQAVNNNQWFVLVQIAKDLQIELPSPEDGHLLLLQEELKAIKKLLNDRESTYAWLFFNQQDDMKRRVLMIMYLKNFGIDLAKDVS